MRYYNMIIKNGKNINILKLILLLLELGLILISISFIIFIFKYNKRITKVENDIKKIKMDYQFLDYNKEQLKEYYGK